jgi:phosphoenolpyruvate carboxykinase (GTP)
VGDQPEAGFFGVAPGTGESTNVAAVETLWGNTIFTNVALRPTETSGGRVSPTTSRRADRLGGQALDPGVGRPAAHPNSRFTVSARSARRSPRLGAPEGVPLDGILFGGRRATNVPLVVEATDWTHGVFLGSNISSERTAAAEGPSASCAATRSRCCRSAATTWRTTSATGSRSASVCASTAPAHLPGQLVPQGRGRPLPLAGFGDNARVIDWIIRRIEGVVPAIDSPIGPAARGPEPRRHRGAGCRPRRPVRDRPRPVAAGGRAHGGVLPHVRGRVPPALYAELAALRYRLKLAAVG